MAGSIRIRFINNDGAGFSDQISVREGITVQELLAERGVTNPSQYTIRVNREECVLENDVVRDGDRVQAIARPGTVSGSERVLSEGERVSVTPKKIAGAKLAALYDLS